MKQDLSMYDNELLMKAVAKEIIAVLIKNKLSFDECEQALRKTEFVLKITSFPSLDGCSE